MKKDRKKVEKFMNELIGINIIDDTNINSYEDWVHLYWAAQEESYNSEFDIHEIMIMDYIYAILEKTSTIIFKLDKNSIWKFKSGITEKEFKFKWVLK